MWTFVHYSFILTGSVGGVRCITVPSYGSDPSMASFSRRAASVLAGSALAFSLVSVPSALVASAAADTRVCAKAASESSRHTGTYVVQNSVLGAGEAAPSGELTYRVAVTGPGALITSLRHHHDPALVPVRARVGSFKLLSARPTWSDHTQSMVREGNTVKVGGAGWTTAGGNAAVLEVTYKVPANASVGTQYDSGAGYTAALINGSRDFQDMGVCGTVRAPNAVESAQGSLEGVGAGSLVEGSVSSSNISSDPSGFVGEAIGGILGNVIGGAIGS